VQLSAIQTFLAVAETGALSRAADRLNVSQSTVTARLNALEDQIGQPLIHRRRSGAELTPAGFKFQRYAELIGQLWKQAQLETSLPAAISSVCNIGCHFDLWSGYADALVRMLKQRAPGVAFSVWPGEQTDIDRWLGNGLIEAAFCHAPPQMDGLTHHALRPEKLLMCSTLDVMAANDQQAQVYVDFGEAFRRDHAKAFANAATPMATFGSAALALDYLIEYGGTAYLPMRLAEPYLDSGVLKRIPTAPIFSRSVWFACMERVEALTPVIGEYVTELRQ